MSPQSVEIKYVYSFGNLWTNDLRKIKLLLVGDISYGNPTNVKLDMLNEIQVKYTNKINEFIEIMISDKKYYLDLINNNKKSRLIRNLEKSNRGDLGSALGQNAIDHAVKELYNFLIRIKNYLYGNTLDTYLNIFVSYTSILNSCIQELTYEEVILNINHLISNTKKDSEIYEELLYDRS